MTERARSSRGANAEDGESVVASGAATAKSVARPTPVITDDDIYLFNEGSHLRLYDILGCHPGEIDGIQGAHFAVWAPDADSVSVIGDFNSWNTTANPLKPRATSGIWHGFFPGVAPGTMYKYRIHSRYNGYRVEKADPFAVRSEVPPRTGSVVWSLDYEWHDSEWMATRKEKNSLSSPISVYE